LLRRKDVIQGTDNKRLQYWEPPKENKFTALGEKCEGLDFCWNYSILINEHYKKWKEKVDRECI